MRLIRLECTLWKVAPGDLTLKLVARACNGRTLQGHMQVSSLHYVTERLEDRKRTGSGIRKTARVRSSVFSSWAAEHRVPGNRRPTGSSFISKMASRLRALRAQLTIYSTWSSFSRPPRGSLKLSCSADHGSVNYSTERRACSVQTPPGERIKYPYSYVSMLDMFRALNTIY